MKLKEFKEDLGQGASLDMVLIPAGKFLMGSPASEFGRNDNETQHEVRLTKPFYMGKYEVTQEQWKAVMGTGFLWGLLQKLGHRRQDWEALLGTRFLWFGGNPSRIKGAKLPVTDVSWEDCQYFIKKLNSKTDGGYRLPTEAEWEYACRASTTSAYSIGNRLTKNDANYGGGTLGGTMTVGSYKPNAFGLYDMHSNVWEWCNDWHGSLQDGTVWNPNGTTAGEYRVIRGGAFNSVGSETRSSFRGGIMPTVREDSIGFRLARTQ